MSDIPVSFGRIHSVDFKPVSGGWIVTVWHYNHESRLTEEPCLCKTDNEMLALAIRVLGGAVR